MLHVVFILVLIVLAPCSNDSDELGVKENEFRDKLEVLAPITLSHFRSYIKLPLGSLKESKNEEKRCVERTRCDGSTVLYSLV